MSAMQQDAWCFNSSLQDKSWLRKRPACFHFDRCQGTVRSMGAEPVVPIAVAIEPMLDCRGPERQPRSLRPSLHITEDPLDLGIEMPCPDLAADMCQAEPLDSAAELGPEVAAKIGHKEPRHRLFLLRSLLDQI